MERKDLNDHPPELPFEEALNSVPEIKEAKACHSDIASNVFTVYKVEIIITPTYWSGEVENR